MKFLFTTLDFYTGGVTTSLCNLTSTLIDSGHEVYILCLNNNLKNIEIFNPKVNILALDNKSKLRNRGFKDYQKAKGLRKLKLFLYGIFKKGLNKLNLLERYTFFSLPKFNCDIAIAFRQSNALNYIVSKKTNAKHTFAFIHSEIYYIIISTITI